MNADLNLIKFAGGLYERLVKDFRKLIDDFVQKASEATPYIRAVSDIGDHEVRLAYFGSTCRVRWEFAVETKRLPILFERYDLPTERWINVGRHLEFDGYGNLYFLDDARPRPLEDWSLQAVLFLLGLKIAGEA